MKNIYIHKILKANLTLSILALVIGAIYRIIESPTSGNYVSLDIINIGIFLIIIAPVLRVFLELFFFIKEKNYTYVIVCISLFIIIAISIIC